MKHYTPINLFSAEPQTVIPSLTAQRVEFQCFHCYRPTMIAVPTAYIDWEPIAEDYRKHLQKIFTDMGNAIQEIELIHGMENPVTQFYRNKWAMLALEIQTHFGNAPKGTSAHQRDDGEDMNEGWKNK